MGEDELLLFQVKCNAEQLRFRIEKTLRLFESIQKSALTKENLRGYAPQHGNAVFNRHTQGSRVSVGSRSSISGRLITQ